MAAQMDGDGGSNGGLEARVGRLEEFAADARERLIRIEARLDGFELRFVRLEARLDNFAQLMDAFAERLDSFVTKDAFDAGLAKMEARLLKWFIMTIIATASLAFTVAKLVH